MPFRSFLPAFVFVGFLLTTSAGADYQPWDALVGDSWIYFGPPQERLVMHSVNAGDYEVGFDQRRGDGSARGMNVLRFYHEGTGIGHLATTQLVGSFDVQNVGAARTFDDLLLLVAVDAPSLPAGFALTLGLNGSAPYQFDPATDFGYYDQPTYDTGRPSGYYSQTSPPREGVSYAFETGMVSVLALPGAALGPGQSVTVDYAFENLPGLAVFGVYGVDPNVGWIYHTNRTVIDNNRPNSPVSTFAVLPTPLGDMNCDGAFNGADIDPFFLALGDPAGYAARFPECDINKGDMNGDGSVNGADIDPFFECLGGGGCP